MSSKHQIVLEALKLSYLYSGYFNPYINVHHGETLRTQQTAKCLMNGLTSAQVYQSNYLTDLDGLKPQKVVTKGTEPLKKSTAYEFYETELKKQILDKLISNKIFTKGELTKLTSKLEKDQRLGRYLLRIAHRRLKWEIENIIEQDLFEYWESAAELGKRTFLSIVNKIEESNLSLSIHVSHSHNLIALFKILGLLQERECAMDPVIPKEIPFLLAIDNDVIKNPKVHLETQGFLG